MRESNNESYNDFSYHFAFRPKERATSQGDGGWYVECAPQYTPGGPLAHCAVTIDVTGGTRANAERLAQDLVESGAKIRVRPLGAIVAHVPLSVILPELDVPQADEVESSIREN